MRNLLLLTLLLLGMGVCLQAQPVYPGHNVFLEVGGNGGIYSLNYENPFRIRPNAAVTFRTGLSITPADRKTLIILPVMFNGVFLKGNHHPEVGAGVGISAATSGGGSWVRGILQVGYRFQKPEKPLFFRVNYTPFYNFFLHAQWENWAGASIGWTFQPKEDK